MVGKRSGDHAPDFDTGSEDAIFLTNADGAITYVNGAFERIYGVSSEEILGRVPHVVEDGGVQLAHDQEFWAKVVTPQVVSLDVPRRGGEDGEVVHVVGSASPVIDDHGDVVGFIAVHRQGEAEVDEQPIGSAYHGVFEQLPVPTWIVDMATLRFLVVNDAAIARYGYSRAEFLAMTIADIRDPSEVPALKAYLTTRKPGTARAGVWRHRRKDGSTMEVELTSQLFEVRDRRCLLVNARDLTEQRRLEEQFLQAQKLEAVGRLAGSVAHDFNNLLSVILSYVSLAKEGIPTAGSLHEDLEEIERAAQRAASLTGQLLVFSRRQVVEPRTVAIDHSISSMSKMLGRLLGEDIELRMRTASDSWAVRLDPAQIDQVLMNLAINARDAMPTGGSLTIETANLVLDEAHAEGIPGAKAGPHVRISVTDTGTGMTPEIRQHMFEPFFTTKEVGKGTGLGLATVFGIVRRCGGAIRVDTEVGRGTRFEIFLPRCAPDHAPTSAPTPQSRRNGAASNGAATETILLVEDDDQLRRLLEQVLRKEGYEVLAAANPADACDLAEHHPGRVSLLLTDVVMPIMSGPKLATILTESRPGLLVLFMTGYSGAALAEQGILDSGPVTLLRKPITPKELLLRVRERLGPSIASGTA